MNVWRRSLYALAIVVMGVVCLSGSALAMTTPEVIGNVTESGAIAPGASVNVTCTNPDNSQHVRNVVTSGTGHYSVSFAPGTCDDGANVVATATSSDGSASGQASGTMGNGGVSQRLNLDVSVLTTTALPELGLLTACIATAACAMAVVLIRRRANLPQT